MNELPTPDVSSELLGIRYEMGLEAWSMDDGDGTWKCGKWLGSGAPPAVRATSIGAYLARPAPGHPLSDKRFVDYLKGRSQ